MGHFAQLEMVAFRVLDPEGKKEKLQAVFPSEISTSDVVDERYYR